MASTFITNNITQPIFNTGAVSGSGGAGAGVSTITLTGAGSSGQYLTVGGGGAGLSGYAVGSTTIANGGTYSTAWSPPSQNFVSNNGKAVMTIPADKQEVILEKDATLDIKGNVRMNGVDLEERLETIEKVLQIPTRDATMEAKHPKLAELYKAYMHELEKYKTWERIKGKDE